MTDKQIKKILLIDDDKAIAELYEIAFSQHDEYELVVAYNSKDGKRMATEDNISLILLDLVFPKEEGLADEEGKPIKIQVHAGYELLKKLKEDEKTKDIPVVILTNLADGHEDEANARRLGAIEYLVKSKFLPRQVIDRIGQILGE
jgi:DNA-binding response OmpR family regulator